MRKGVRIALWGAALLIVASTGAAFLAQDRILDHVIRERLRHRPDMTLVNDRDHVRVLICGTGSPEVSAARAQACTLVAAGGKLFLFDTGDGAVRSLELSEVPLGQLTRVFITHFHSDHFNDLAPLINTSWIWGRTTPLDVEGPVGMNTVLAGLTQAYSLDQDYRATHMPNLAKTRAVARGNPIEVRFGEGQRSARVYDEGGVTIDAVQVVHDPVKPALGYVLRYRGKKVFISGDTQVSPLNLPSMKDADLVVHEAYATHMVRRAIPQMKALGMNAQAEIAERTIPYHADTIALARQAQQAGVKHLVLTHLTPFPDGMVARHMFVQGMDQSYHGKLTVARDGEWFIL